ncbi:MAG: hypothetical protein ACT4N5_06365 [Nitrosopumilaceae archaeon]
MNKKQEKIFVLAATGVVVIIFIFGPWQNSYLGLFVDTIAGPNWDKLSPHDIVKNEIPLTLITKFDGSCKMSAENLGNVIEHQYFVRGQEFANKVRFDPIDSSIVIPCEMNYGERSRLHVWYVKEEATKYGGEFKYFVTPWSEITP